ncbi:MAG TPA: ABC transporter permease, partial [Propionibacteriaceae bacterium]|nr:ABC transporter permease [Propionibacteriaceae bacterium]
MTQTTKPATEGGGAVAVERRSRFATLDWRRYVIYIGFVVIFIFFAILLGDQGFLSPNNLLNILRQSATITVIAVGMTYVIACAEIDLSVGSVAGLASVVTAMAVANWGVVAGVIAGLLVGVVVGSINGGLVAGLGIPSFLVTLGMLGIAFGLAQWITDSAPQPILSYAYNLAFGSGNLGPFPGLVVWMAIFVAVGAIVLSKTRFGRQVLATGGNRMAAEFTGINTKRIKFEVLLISGTVAAFAG